MSATNHTTNYELPIFVGTDKPAWLVDWNGAMTAIDTAIHNAEGKADQAGTDIGGIESSISTINSTLTSINNAVSQLRIDTNANTGSINTITSLIGNGEPTTTDKTIIGAINEINSQVYDFNLSQVSVSVATTKGTMLVNNVKALLNADASVGKIYGKYGFRANTVISPTDVLATITIQGLNTPTAYDIDGFFVNIWLGATSEGTIAASHLHFNVGNTVDVILDEVTIQANDPVGVFLPPCLLFLKDLGD